MPFQRRENLPQRHDEARRLRRLQEEEFRAPAHHPQHAVQQALHGEDVPGQALGGQRVPHQLHQQRREQTQQRRDREGGEAEGKGEERQPTFSATGVEAGRPHDGLHQRRLHYGRLGKFFLLKSAACVRAMTACRIGDWLYFL